MERDSANLANSRFHKCCVLYFLKRIARSAQKIQKYTYTSEIKLIHFKLSEAQEKGVDVTKNIAKGGKHNNDGDDKNKTTKPIKGDTITVI